MRRTIGALGVAALFVVTAWPALRATSAIYDETTFVPAGWTHVARGDMRLGPEAPWLVKTLFGLSVLGLRPVVSADAEHAFDAAARSVAAQWIFGDRFLYRDNSPAAFLFRARLVSMALAAALVVLVYAWAHELFGTPGSLFAGALAALDPNFLAHGTLATTDIGSTLFLFATAFFVRRAFRALTVRDGVLAALACAAAFGSKFNATLLVPTLALFWVVRVVRADPWPVPGRVVSDAARRAVAAGVLLLFCSLVTIGSLWIVYGSTRHGALDAQLRGLRRARVAVQLNERGTSIPDVATLEQLVDRTPPGTTERLIAAAARWRLVPEQYLVGLTYATAQAQARPSYLLGTLTPVGSPPYFPVAFGVKTPVATLVVFALALLLACDARSVLRRRGETVWLLAPAAIVFVAATASHLNIGHRHVLPVYPFLYVAAGAVPGELRRLVGARAAAVVAAAALAALGLETMSARPYFLSFFNRLAGGPAGGLDILSDSNLDWGQGLVALRRWMDERGVDQVNLCYFGSADPAAYGIRFVPLPGSYRLEVRGAGTAGYDPRPPTLPGWVAIGATNLQGTYFDRGLRDAYRFLRDRHPSAVLAGGAMYVYWLDRWPG